MVTKLGKYSYSALQTFESCPKKFQFTYIDKVSREKKGHAAAIMGNVVHTVLQKLYKHAFENVLVSKEDMNQFYKDEWNKYVIDYIEVTSDFKTVDDYITDGETILDAYYDKFQPFNQAKLLGTELNLYFTLPNTDFQFNCRIDRLSRREDGVVEIVDYKTGSLLSKAKDKNYYFQMGLYLLAVRANYPDFKEIELVQYFLRHGEEVRYQMREDEEENLIEQFHQAIIATLQATELNSFEPKESSHCNFCDFVEICPAKIHQIMLESETETGEISALKLKELADAYIEKNKNIKALSEDIDAIKTQMVEIAKQHNISIFESEYGKVNVSIKNDIKFVTKTDNPEEFADLNALCRAQGLDEFFVLDRNALMKDLIKKHRAEQSLLDKLQKYIIESESLRFSVRKKSTKDDDEPNIIE